MFDVVRYKGRKVEDLPYSEKLEMLKNINKHVPELRLPEIARTKMEKMQLLEKIRTGQHPETAEGVVIYELDKALPVKAKMLHDYDAKIIGTFLARPGTKYEGNAVGGFVVAPEYDQKVRVRVGTGISDEIRRDAYNNPSKYIGQ